MKIEIDFLNPQGDEGDLLLATLKMEVVWNGKEALIREGYEIRLYYNPSSESIAYALLAALRLTGGHILEALDERRAATTPTN